MRQIIFVLIAMASFATWAADEVKIEINPTKPVVGEVFRAYFRIFTDSSDEPAINFVPSSIEVVGKSNQGVSTRTVYSNGNLTVTREMTFVYELVASKTGNASLRDINIQLGGKTLRHPSVSFNVLAEAEEKSDVFVMADVPKKDVFVGEGVLVRYYVYSKYTTPVRALEVKKFPKLNHFLKRYLQEPESPERVNVDGQPYVRRIAYTAKLFPEKAGELKVDPLQLAITFAQVSSSDPFGAFGFAREFRTKNFNSDVVVLNVKPLPEPIPSHFTGLIGRHEFSLEIPNPRLIVNEPLEAKLIVSGGGMLEALEAPAVIKHPGFEEFETNGDLKISDPNNATKTFDYTYLAKENLKIPATTLTLSYFDPSSMKYVPTQLPVPELVVAGGQASSPKNDKTEKKEKAAPNTATIPQTVNDLSGPLFTQSIKYRNFLPYVNLVVAIASFLVALSWFVKADKLPTWSKGQEIPREFRRGEFSFGEFARWLSPLIQKTGKAPVAIIKESDLDESAKAYFIDLLNANDYKDYASQKKSAKFEYRSSYFKSLSKYIASATHDGISKS